MDPNAEHKRKGFNKGHRSQSSIVESNVQKQSKKQSIQNKEIKSKSTGPETRVRKHSKVK